MANDSNDIPVAFFIFITTPHPNNKKPIKKGNLNQKQHHKHKCGTQPAVKMSCS